MTRTAVLYLRNGFVEKGRRILHEAAEIAASSPFREGQVEQLALISALMGQYSDEGTAESLMKAARIGLDDLVMEDPVQRIFLEARINAYAGEYEQAIQTISKIVNAEDRMNRMSSLIYDAMDIGRLEGARFLLNKVQEEYQKMNSEEKKKFSLLHQVSTDYIKIGDIETALRTMQATDKPKDKVAIHVESARKLISHGERKQAEEHLLQALRFNSEVTESPDKIWALGDIAFLFAEMGSMEKADEALKEAVLSFKNAEPLNRFHNSAVIRIIEAYVKAQKFDEALEFAHDILHQVLDLPETPNSSLRTISDVLRGVVTISSSSRKKFPLEGHILREVVEKLDRQPDFFTVEVPEAIEHVYMVVKTK